MANIFTITLLAENTDNRCIGYFHSIEKAKAAVESDAGGMHECLYMNAVIEEKIEAAWSTKSANEYWYRYDGCTCNGKTIDCYGKWVECKKPESLEGTIAFGIG